MKRVLTVLAAAATICAPTSALAAEHTITILDFAYFPQITYLATGDTVHFINASGLPHTIIAADEDWEIGPIPMQGEASIVITEGMATTFFDKDSSDDDGNFAVEGGLSLSSAPLK